LRSMLIVITVVAVLIMLAYVVLPSTPLYAIGNVRWARYINAFGFKSPMPDSFLHPANLLTRLSGVSKDNATTYVEYKERFEKTNSCLATIEYMPDKTLILLSRRMCQPKESTTAELVLRMLNSGHLLEGLPLRYVDPIEKPLVYQKVLGGKLYECAETQLGVDGSDRPASKIKESEKFRCLFALRRLTSADQTFQVQIMTPGRRVNFDAANQLLNCMDLE
jgi:hypothetical protein